MRQISAACRNELKMAANRENGRLSPMAYERHGNALKIRGLIDAQSIITDEGRDFLIRTKPKNKRGAPVGSRNAAKDDPKSIRLSIRVTPGTLGRIRRHSKNSTVAGFIAAAVERRVAELEGGR